jgi:uncharacterized protein YbgA (DUF1722 family)
MTVRPRVACSRGLLEHPGHDGCGYGRRFLTDQLARHVDWVPICPDLTGVDGCVVRFPSSGFGLLPIVMDGRLGDVFLRERFVERIFAHARLRELFVTEWRPRNLVDFHSRHKIQILAHDPARYRELGRIVATAGTQDRRLIEEDYTRLFMRALASRAERGSHVNALQHLLGPMSANLDDARRHDLAEVIEDFGRGLLPLSVPIALLRHDARGTANDYLQDQTYLAPFPAELALRNHI